MSRVAQFLAPKVPKDFGAKAVYLSPSDWMERNFYIPETQRPIKLKPHQRSLIEYMLDEANEFRTLIYSTIKKSGKTAIAGAMGRYLAETSGYRAEILTVANDMEQARSRSYQAIISSIELSPGFDRNKNTLPNQWKVIEKHAVHIPTQSVIRAIANDYKGEAGSNPTCTLWTELWGIKSEAGRRLYAELTPVPTRKRSLRIVETYAGFEDESEILLDLFILGQRGKRLSHDDIDWPFPDQPPVWVNREAGLCMYWDTGVNARRMPWQLGKSGDAYYNEQRETLKKEEYERLHENIWQSSVSEFIRPEWWIACQEEIPPLIVREPCVLGVDASVSGDCTALSLVSRHTDPKRRETDVMVRAIAVWYPRSMGGVMDYAELEQTIREWCKKYNVVQIAYDAYQLHDMMQRLARDSVAWCNAFSQMAPRALADKQLYDLIVQRRIAHNGNSELLQHVKNAAAKNTALEQEKMRLEKKRKDTPIDLVVATSMATYEALRLNI